MGRKKQAVEIQEEGTAQVRDVTTVLRENYIPYAMSVIISRALPAIDGFKPSHRRLLYTMYKQGLLKGGKQKSAKIVGATMSLNPHGDAAIYKTLVRLTEGNETLLYPFIDSKGNFGKRYSRDITYAAARYTEAQLAPIAAELFQDIDKGIVEMRDNYDSTIQEPMLLPTTFPNVLVTTNTGIAVGMSSSIPSFNLEEVCNATIALLKNEKADVYEIVKAPDFASGGSVIYDAKDARKVLSTGLGTFKLKATVEVKKDSLWVTEIPFTTSIEVIIEKIKEQVQAGKLKEITDVHDEIDKDGFGLSIEFKRGTDTDKLLNDLYALTPLMDNFSCNFNLIIDGRPQVLGVDDILKLWIKFRRDTLTKYFKYMFKKVEHDILIAEGLQKVALDIDKAVQVIRDTAVDKEVVPNMMKAFDLQEVQAVAVCNIRLRNLNKEYLLHLARDLDKWRKERGEYLDKLEKPKALDAYIIKQLKDIIKRYGQPRKTTIVEAAEHVVVKPVVTVDDSRVYVFITKEGYVKKVSLNSVKAQTATNKLKEGDSVIAQGEVGNATAELLMFTNKANVYKLPLHKISLVTMRELGVYAANEVKLDPDEKVISVHYTDGYKGHFYFGFENGKVAKVPLTSYETKLNRKKLSKAYNEKSALVGIAADYDLDTHLYLESSGKAIVCDVTSIQSKDLKSAAGNQTLKLKKECLVEVFRLATEDEVSSKLRVKTLPAPGKAC